MLRKQQLLNTSMGAMLNGEHAEASLIPTASNLIRSRVPPEMGWARRRGPAYYGDVQICGFVFFGESRGRNVHNRVFELSATR